MILTVLILWAVVMVMMLTGYNPLTLGTTIKKALPSKPDEEPKFSEHGYRIGYDPHYTRQLEQKEGIAVSELTTCDDEQCSICAVRQGVNEMTKKALSPRGGTGYSPKSNYISQREKAREQGYCYDCYYRYGNIDYNCKEKYHRGSNPKAISTVDNCSFCLSGGFHGDDCGGTCRKELTTDELSRRVADKLRPNLVPEYATVKKTFTMTGGYDFEWTWKMRSSNEVWTYSLRTDGILYKRATEEVIKEHYATWRA